MNTPEQPHQKLESFANHERATFDEDGSRWKEVQERLIRDYKHIVALRGAGSSNGIDRDVAEKLIVDKLIPQITQYLEDGSVALMFDGDSDNEAKPDIGFVVGRLRDLLDSEVGKKLTFVTAQKQSWYYPSHNEPNLSKATGKEYETIVFPDGKFPGEHNSFTQSEELSNASGYEQWYIGASGPIANEQLEDFNSKIKEGVRKIRMFKAPLNEKLNDSVEEGRRDAEEMGNVEKLKKIEEIIEQRKQKYGAHFDTEGNLTLDTKKYQHLSFEIL